MKHFLLLLLMLIGKLCFSQTADVNTRAAFDLKLFVNDTAFYQAPMKASQFIVQNKIVQLFPGECIFVEADVVKDSLVNLKVVPAIVHKEKTLTISFTQDYEGKLHKQMLLKIINPFSKQLEYGAQINLMKYKRWIETSVLPVQPGLVSYENWPDIITTIILLNFHLKS